jgi:hypothetical protein
MIADDANDLKLRLTLRRGPRRNKFPSLVSWFLRWLTIIVQKTPRSPRIVQTQHESKELATYGTPSYASSHATLAQQRLAPAQSQLGYSEQPTHNKR